VTISFSALDLVVEAAGLARTSSTPVSLESSIHSGA